LRESASKRISKAKVFAIREKGVTMRSQQVQDPLDGLLDDYAIENLDWPESPKELDRFLLEDIEDVPPTGISVQEQLPLFSVSAAKSVPSPLVRDSSWDSIVRAAYLKIYDGDSIDKVIADPDRNARYVQACWALGARATQFQLNRALLNARKNKLIGSVQGVVPYHVPRELIDAYLFASEVALRLVQEKQYYENQRSVSLDHILCDPVLAREFEELARSIAPGYSSLDYRWAVITIRKAQRSGVVRSVFPDFERLGPRHAVQARGIVAGPGFYWVRKGPADVYIGHAENLRSHIEQLLEAHATRLPAIVDMLQLEPKSEFDFAIAPCPNLMSASKREPFKTELVRVQTPRLNFLKGFALVA